MSDLPAPDQTSAYIDQLASQYKLSPKDIAFLTDVMNRGAESGDPGGTGAMVAQLVEQARQRGVRPEVLADISGAAEQLPSNIDWSVFAGSPDKAAARAMIGAGSEAAARRQGWDPSTEDHALPAADIANAVASRKLTTAPNAMVDAPKVTDFATQVLPDAGKLAWNALTNTEAQAGAGERAAALGLSTTPALAMLGNGLLQNPLGALARTSLGYGTMQGTQGLGIAYPDSGAAATTLDAVAAHDRGGLMDAARRYGVRVGGYSDPQQLIDAAEKAIAMRRFGMIEAGVDPAEADAWANGERNRVQGVLATEGGVQGMKDAQYADTAKAVAGVGGAEGTIDNGYRAGLTSNVFAPASMAQAQLDAWKNLGGNARDALRNVAGGARNALGGLDSVVRATNGLPQLPGRTLPTLGGTIREGIKAGGSVLKPLLGTGMAGISAIASLPSYIQAARDQAGLYDTATDPTGANADSLGHQLATEGTRYGSLALQGLGGEAAIPRAIVQGTQAAGAGLANTALGAQLAGKVKPATGLARFVPAAVRNAPVVLGAIRAAGVAPSAGALLGAGVKGAGRALPGLALGSAAIDAGQNVGAATRSLQSLFSGDPAALATVNAENEALANNADWMQDPSFGNAAWSGVKMAMRPTTFARQLLGAKDQIAEAQRGADEGADAIAAQQQTRMMKPIQALTNYRQQLAAGGGDTTAVDAQLSQLRQQVAAAPGQQAWSDVGKWQNGMVGWAVNPFGDHRSRGELGFAEQYKNMDDATRARVDEIVAGVAKGTVDPERARVALGMPAMQDWSPADMQDANKAEANQRWVLNQAEVGTGRNGYTPWQLSGKWQNPAAAAKAAMPSPQPVQPQRPQPPVPATPQPQRPAPQAPVPTQAPPASISAPRTVASANPPPAPRPMVRPSSPFVAPAATVGPQWRGAPI